MGSRVVGGPEMGRPRRRSVKLLCLLVVLLMNGSTTMHTSHPNTHSTLADLRLAGSIAFHNLFHAAGDFGNRHWFFPYAVMHPRTVSDVSSLVRHVFEMGGRSELTVAARGHGHSLHGQAQAPNGVVVMMESLGKGEVNVCARDVEPYVDVSGGALWIDVLHHTLRHGLAPRSWTDYLHLTVGGTLSNAGVSGQAFRHGPQISNVHQLEVVTGKGEVVNCSPHRNADLFFAALGGLGQFGIITKARIALEPPPKKVRWIRVLYSDFAVFAEDQETLISGDQTTFDYIEGFVIKNRKGILNNWRSFLKPQHADQASNFESGGKTLFCLELTKNLYSDDDVSSMNLVVNTTLSKLRHIPSTMFHSEVSYVEFLDRVRASELTLKARGLWDVPHPWLNLFVPGTRIRDFADEVFGKIITHSSNGPIIIYPADKSKWDNRTSAVIPEEEIFYMVAFLSALPSMSDRRTLDDTLEQNRRILDLCRKAGISAKQYLPHYTTVEEWKAHFGDRWETFVQRKVAYDPLAILAPGQKIFQKLAPPSSHHHLSTTYSNNNNNNN